MRKIRVLHVTGGLDNGGKERQISELLKNIDHNFYYVGVLVFNDNQHYTQLAKDCSDELYIINKEKSKANPFFQVGNILRKFNPDIIHTWDLISNIYVFRKSKKLGCKIIDGSIRDSGIEKGIYFYLKRFFLKKADLVISNSTSGLKRYKVKGSVIPNLISPLQFNGIKPEIDEFNIIKVANFTHFKDHETFIKASINLIKGKFVDRVFLIGSGQTLPKWKAYVNKMNLNISSKFIFLGKITEIEKYLALCKIGVLCSTSKYSEGLSNSLLEYISAGLIPISTNIGGSPEIIEHGVNGFLFNKGDVNELVRIIETLRFDNTQLEKIRQNGKLTLNRKFNSETILNQYYSAYTGLATSLI